MKEPERSNSRAKGGMSLSERLTFLSPKRQEIVRPAFHNPRGFVLLSIRDTAKRLKTDPATMVRIVRGLKFRTYREFQKYLQELSIAYATSMDTMQMPTPGGTKASVANRIRASLEQDMQNLDRLGRGVDLRQVEGLARRLYAAHKIVLIGGDLASILIRFLEYQLNVLGLPICAATGAGDITHRVMHAGKNDVVLAISYRRGLRQTVEGLRDARANGAYCVGITDSLISPLNQFADECFLTSVDTPSFGASYVAPIALCNSIIVACANYRRSRTLALVKHLEQEQRHGFRWYDS